MVGTTANYREGNQPVISMFEKKFTGIKFSFFFPRKVDYLHI